MSLIFDRFALPNKRKACNRNRISAIKKDKTKTCIRIAFSPSNVATMRKSKVLYVVRKHVLCSKETVLYTETEESF